MATQLREGEKMFPSTLDNAEVIYYTPKGDYGKMYYTNGEVETDLLMDSIEECMNSARLDGSVCEVEWYSKG